MTRYQIKGIDGKYFDVFNKKAEAIKEAIKLGTEYTGITFLVIKRSINQEQIIFKFKQETTVEFDDLNNYYDGMIKVYQEKLKKIQRWR
jgi:hypothetical protein